VIKNIKFGDVSIPVTQYASQGNAILGIRDSGKTYSATYVAEQLYEAGIPFVAFDPSGVWKFLRVPGNGKGLPVVVAGGKNPDLPLTPQSAPEIVRAAMKANVSLVIDLYDINLSKADWGRIVEACIRVLLYENGEHGLRHIFIEEAAEFVPQQIQTDKAKVYAEVEKLARIGGNALLGYTLVNQRAEQVNKAVLELCDCLLLHRQKGKNSLTSLSKWLEYSQGGSVKDLIKSLPTLPSGQCWIWPANADNATLVKMPAKQSFHPDRRALIANPAVANVKRVDATRFVTELKNSLEAVVQEAEANDPKKLKARISELERKVRDFENNGANASPAQLDMAKRNGFEEARKQLVGIDRINTGKAVAAFKDLSAQMIRIANELERDSGAVLVADSKTTLRDLARDAHKRGAHIEVSLIPTEKRETIRRENHVTRNSTSDLPKGERIVLTAIAQYESRGVETDQLFVLTGYKSRSITEYISRLRSKGYINEGWPVTATSEGIAALGSSFEPLPTGDKLLEHWYSRLPAGEVKLLQYIVDAYPKGLNNSQIGELTGYAPRSVTEYISRLKARRIVDRRGGEVVASAELF